MYSQVPNKRPPPLIDFSILSNSPDLIKTPCLLILRKLTSRIPTPPFILTPPLIKFRNFFRLPFLLGPLFIWYLRVSIYGFLVKFSYTINQISQINLLNPNKMSSNFSVQVCFFNLRRRSANQKLKFMKQVF